MEKIVKISADSLETSRKAIVETLFAIKPLEQNKTVSSEEYTNMVRSLQDLETELAARLRAGRNAAIESFTELIDKNKAAESAIDSFVSAKQNRIGFFAAREKKKAMDNLMAMQEKLKNDRVDYARKSRINAILMGAAV